MEFCGASLRVFVHRRHLGTLFVPILFIFLLFHMYFICFSIVPFCSSAQLFLLLLLLLFVNFEKFAVRMLAFCHIASACWPLSRLSQSFLFVVAVLMHFAWCVNTCVCVSVCVCVCVWMRVCEVMHSCHMMRRNPIFNYWILFLEHCSNCWCREEKEGREGKRGVERERRGGRVRGEGREVEVAGQLSRQKLNGGGSFFRSLFDCHHTWGRGRIPSV